MGVADLLDDPGFRDGVVAGAVGLVVVLAIALLGLRPRRARRIPPVAGVAMVLAAYLALDRAGPGILENDRLAVGLLLAVVAPYGVAILVGRRRLGRLLVAAAAVPGAVVLGSSASAFTSLDWVPELVAVTTVVGGALAADLDTTNARTGLGPVLMTIAALGMYATLPDTEEISVVVGALLPLALLGWPVAWAALGPGAYGVVGMLMWVAAVDGRGRPGSVVGAGACLGVLLVEPIARRALRGRRLPPAPTALPVLVVIALQVVVVLGAARIAGLETSAGAAAAIGAVVLLAGAAGTGAILATWGRRPPAATGRAERREGRRAPNS